MTILKKALVVGAGGLIGSCVLAELLKDDDYSEVEIRVRKPGGISHPKLTEKIIDFNDTASLPAINAQHIFCCLGSTIKKAGSQEAFYRVDHDYVVQLAQLAESSSAEKFLVVSSLGANALSKNFYLRTKGEMENDVKKHHFGAIYIFRPSILLGKRKEFRFGEIIGKAVMNFAGIFMFGSLLKYKGIRDRVLAKAMIISAKKTDSGIFTLESDEIQKCGKN